jgi:hypothetical protein
LISLARFSHEKPGRVSVGIVTRLSACGGSVPEAAIAAPCRRRAAMLQSPLGAAQWGARATGQVLTEAAHSVPSRVCCSLFLSIHDGRYREEQGPKAPTGEHGPK